MAGNAGNNRQRGVFVGLPTALSSRGTQIQPVESVNIAVNEQSPSEML
jgi:hypothetical protein